jgi:hypothetical protein
VTENSTSPTLLRFESSFPFSGKFCHSAPGTVFSFSLLYSIVALRVNERLSVILANLTIGSKQGSLRLLGLASGIVESQCHVLPEIGSSFVYRTLTGNITGQSRTVVKLSGESFELFEPFPDFCVPDYGSLTTNCSEVSIAKVESGILLQLRPLPPLCEYSYAYRCRFLRWAEFPTSPDRGFVLGPVVAKDSHGLLTYGNAPTLVLPTPDFSMVYNTPMIAGLVFSISFALLGRVLLRRDAATSAQQTKQNGDT